MILTLDIPDDIASHIGVARTKDVERALVEMLALDGYRNGTLNRYQVQRMLGFDTCWETEDWLGARDARMQYSLDDLDTDRRNLDRVLGGDAGK
jgi:hypothetical protein